MKSLLTVTALLEGVTGLLLAFAPAFLVSILLGASLTDPGAIVIGRLAGAALSTIAIACWLARKNTQSAVMIKAMIAYNIFSVILLLYAAFIEKLDGPGLWPAFIIHFGLLAWCFFGLKMKIPK